MEAHFTTKRSYTSKRTYEATPYKVICWKSEKRIFINILLLEVFVRNFHPCPPEAYLKAKYIFFQNFNFLFLMGHSN